MVTFGAFGPAGGHGAPLRRRLRTQVTTLSASVLQHSIGTLGMLWTCARVRPRRATADPVRPAPGRRRAVGPAAAVVLGLLCAGCQLRFDVDVRVDRRGGGHFEVSLAADPELQAQAAQAGADPLGTLAAAGRRLRDQGWRTAERREADGSREVALSADFADAAQFDVLARDLATALAAPELVPLEPMDLEVEEGRLSLVGAAALRPTPVVSELGLSPQEAVRLLRDRDAIAYRITVALPGEVIETTAAARDGSVLIWQVQPGERVEVRAAGVRPGPPVWPIAVGGLLGALAAGAALRRILGVRTR